MDVGYFSLGMGADGASAGTRESLVGATLNDNHAFRDGRGAAPCAPAERVRTFPVKGKERSAISVGGAEHYTLPPVHPTLLEVNVYLGWFGPLAKPLQAGALAGTVALKLPGVRSVLQAAGERLVSLAGAPEAGTTPGTLSWVPAIAYDAAGEPLAEVHLPARTPTTSPRRSSRGPPSAPPAGNRPHAVGAVGPVEAFGLDALEQGCARRGCARSARTPQQRRHAQERAGDDPGRAQLALRGELQRRLRRPLEQLPAHAVQRPRGGERPRLAQRPHLARAARSSPSRRGSR